MLLFSTYSYRSNIIRLFNVGQQLTRCPPDADERPRSAEHANLRQKPILRHGKVHVMSGLKNKKKRRFSETVRDTCTSSGHETIGYIHLNTMNMCTW